jgi:protein-disulfide isomerase
MMHALAFGLAVAFATQSATAPSQAPAAGAPAQASTPAASSDDCGCAGERPDVLAVVNGVKIPASDVETALKDRDYPTWGDVEDTRQGMYSYLIDAQLIDREARRRGVALSSLMQTEVYAKVKEPTDDELRAVYEKNKADLKVPYEQARAKTVEIYHQHRVNAELSAFGKRLRAAWHAKVADKLPSPPATPKDRATVIATTDGASVTLGDVEDELRSLLYATRFGAYVGAKAILDEKIDDALIAQEASRRGIAVDALVAGEVTPKVRAVTPADVSKYYEENQQRFVDQALADAEGDIRSILHREAVAAAKRELAAPLRKTARIQVYLAEPVAPIYSIDVTDRPMRGNPSAAVTLVEFYDFECPHCGAAQPMIEALLKEYGDRIRVVAFSFPLSNHPHAFMAAEAAEAARAQGKYWQYAALLFANGSSLSVEKFGQLASQLGLDRARFDRALEAGTFNEHVARDMRDGWRLGVVGTPWYFVNGKAIADNSPAAMRAALDAALAASRR